MSAQIAATNIEILRTSNSSPRIAATHIEVLMAASDEEENGNHSRMFLVM